VINVSYQLLRNISAKIVSILVPRGFYFGKHHLIGSLEYIMTQSRQTEYDIISFGLQTLSMSAQVFRLESDSNLYSLEYEIVIYIYFSFSFLIFLNF
jgi:hypothetical protein